MNYLIVLFKNKEKKKIIKKFITYDKCHQFFKKKMDLSNEVFFSRQTENGLRCEFELGLIKVGKEKNDLYLRDELGRNIKIEIEDDYTILKINPYNIEETFVDYQTKEKIDSHKFIKKYLKGANLKVISKLNNKLIVQNDDDIKLFTFKTISDCNRFVDTLEKKLERKDCMIVKDMSTAHRKYLYEYLESKGFSRGYLLRHLTSHPEKK